MTPEQQPATKKDLADLAAQTRQDIANLAAQTRQDIANLAAQTKQDITDLAAQTKQDLANQEARIVERLTETMREMQTEILRGLERFARGNFARMARLEASDNATNERLTALEERVLALETRSPKH